MASNPRNFPFYNWVPKPLGIIFLIILFIPIMTISGVYSVNSSEMIGGLGIQSEHISFVGFVTSVGMAAFSPFFYDLVCLRRQKMMSVVGFSILFALSYVCAKTDSIFLLAVCSLIMGFVRQTLLMTTLFTLIKYGFRIEATKNLTPGNEPTTEEGWDKLDTEKTTSMPTIYFFFMILGQMGTWLTAYLAYAYEWQYVYYFMMAAMLVAIVISMVAMPYHKYPMKKFPINFSKFGNVVVFSMMCCSFIFIMVYGKVLDWYSLHPYGHHCVCGVYIALCVSGAYTQVALFLAQHFEVAQCAGRHPAVLRTDDLQFQCHVCQRVCQCGHEDRQLAECHPWQLGTGGLFSGFGDGSDMQCQGIPLEVALLARFSAHRSFCPLYVF